MIIRDAVPPIILATILGFVGRSPPMPNPSPRVRRSTALAPTTNTVANTFRERGACNCMSRIGRSFSNACIDALIEAGEVSRAEAERRKRADTRAAQFEHTNSASTR